MKIKFHIDCTPEEARQFLGLPNFAPLQESVPKRIAWHLIKTMFSAGWDAVQKRVVTNTGEGSNGVVPKQDEPNPQIAPFADQQLKQCSCGALASASDQKTPAVPRANFSRDDNYERFAAVSD